MGQTLEYLLKLTDQFSGPMRHARDEQGKFVAGTKQMAGASGNINTLGNAFVGLAAKIGAAFTAYKALEAGMSGFKHALSVASSMETTQTAFKTMLGSQDAMLKTLGDIKKLAMETPFEFPELANAGRMLLAFGEEAKDIPDTLRRIGDVSSAIAAPIGEIAEIYGKARTQGQLFAEDINQLTGRGIPIIREFAAILKIPQSEVKKLAEEGKITFPLLDQAFRNLTSSGGQFFGMMAEQAKTSAGLWSTLQDGINDLFLALGTPLNDAIKPVLSDAIELADQLKPTVAEIGVNMGAAVTAVRDFVAEAQGGSGLAAVMGEKLKQSFMELADLAAIPFRVMGAALPGLGKAFMDMLQPAGEWLMAKLDAAALNFSSKIMVGIRDALDAMSKSSFMASMIPGLSDAAKSLNGPAAMAQNDAKLADSRADKIAENMPEAGKAAASHLGEASDAARTKWQEEMARKTKEAEDAANQRQGYDPKDLKGFESQMSSFYDESALKKAPESNPFEPESKREVWNNRMLQRDVENQRKRGKSPEQIKKEKEEAEKKAAQKKAAESAIAENKTSKAGPSTKEPSLAETARKNADGAASKAMAPTGGGLITNGAGKGGDDVRDDGARRIRGYSYRNAGRAGFGGLAEFDRNQLRDGTAGTAIGANSLSRRPAPNVPSAGTARRSQERREAAAAESRRSGGSGGEHPLMGLVKAIQAKVDTLARA